VARDTGVVKAAFLDRDGTIARDGPYCSRVQDFELLPHVPQAIKLLNEHGFKVVVVTNQSGVARGYFTEETLRQIHQHMEEELAKYGAGIDAIYYCPHHPDDGCDCRKPKPKLILQAAEELGINLAFSYMVGDMMQDVIAGKTAGCKTVFLNPDPYPNDAGPNAGNPDHIAPDLMEAAGWMIAQN
jgi:histidinol-phosphate phosphatase family protein